MRSDKRKLILEILLTLALVYMVYRYWGNGEELLTKIFKVIKPFISGAMIAYIVNIIMIRYEKLLSKVIKKEKHANKLRVLSMILSYSTFILSVVLLLIIVIPELLSSLQVLINTYPKAFINLIDKLENNKALMQFLDNLNLDGLMDKSFLEQISRYVQQLFSSIFNISLGLVSSVNVAFSALLSLFISFIFSLYVLSGKEELREQIILLMKTYCKRLYEPICYVCGILDESFRNFFVSQTIDACILGALCFIGMSILRLPYAATISILVGFTALIPVLGAYIGITIGAIMILTVSFPAAVIFVIFLLALQQFENNLIYPRVVGTSVGLPGIWVLVAVSIGGGIFGIVGTLLSVPTAAALYKILKADVARRNRVEAEESI